MTPKVRAPHKSDQQPSTQQKPVNIPAVQKSNEQGQKGIEENKKPQMPYSYQGYYVPRVGATHIQTGKTGVSGERQTKTSASPKRAAPTLQSKSKSLV